MIKIIAIISEYPNICISKYSRMKQANDSIKKVSEIIKTLGHPERLKILLLLSKKKRKMSVTDIHQSLGLTQPETSRHLIILKNGSVLTSEKEGSNSLYSINEEHYFITCIANCMNKFKDDL